MGRRLLPGAVRRGLVRHNGAFCRSDLGEPRAAHAHRLGRRLFGVADLPRAVCDPCDLQVLCGERGSGGRAFHRISARMVVATSCG